MPITNEKPPDTKPQTETTQNSAPIAKARPKDLLFKPKSLIALLKDTFHEWSHDKGSRMGAALAYYTIFSIAPLLIIAIAIAGFIFGAKAAQGAVVSEMQGLIGQDGAKALETMIQSAHKPSTGIIATILSFAGLLLGASGVFAELQEALNSIWNVETEKSSGIWGYLRGRFLSVSTVVGTGFLMLVSLLLSAGLTGAEKYFTGPMHGYVVLLHVVALVVSLVVITILFAMIFKILPDVKIPWSDVWFGAAMTALFFTLGKYLIGLYIGKSLSTSVYGAAGSLVVIVAWAYYSAQILYFGAELTKVYARGYGSDPQGEANAKIETRAAAPR